MRCRWPPLNSCGNFSPSAAARPTWRQQLPTRSATARPRSMPNARSGSATMSRTRQRGFNEAYGSWKIMFIRRRSAGCARAADRA